MKIRKRIFALGAALAVTAGSILGCGGSGSSGFPLDVSGVEIGSDAGTGGEGGSAGEVVFAGNADRQTISGQSVTSIPLQEELQAAYLYGDKVYGVRYTENGSELFVMDLQDKSSSVTTVKLSDPTINLVGVCTEDGSSLYYIGARLGNFGNMTLYRGDTEGNISEVMPLEGGEIEWMNPIEKAEFIRLGDGGIGVKVAANVQTGHLLDQSLDYDSLFTDEYIAAKDLWHRTTNLMKFNDSGSNTGHLQAVESLDCVYTCLAVNGDGLWTVHADYASGTAALQKLDEAAWQPSVVYEFPVQDEAVCLLAADGQNALVISDGQKLFRYHTDTGSTDQILSWADAGLDSIDLTVEALQVDGDSITALVRNWDGQLTVYLIRPGEGEKKVLTLGTIYNGMSTNPQFAEIINEYNRQSGEYYIQLVDYAEGAESYDTALAKFHIDLMTGQGTDLIDLTGMSKSLLGAAGLLTNLWEFGTDDAWEADYVTEVLNCTAQSGKLYGIGPGFNFYTVAANGAMGVSAGSWTFEEMTEYLEENGRGPRAVGNIGWEDVMVTLGRFALDDFIDWQSKTADFQREDFYSMLEFSREASQSSTAWASGSPEEIASGECLASFETINQVADYQLLQERYRGQAVLKGFPCSEGTGIAVQMFAPIGVHAGSDQQEAAWDFLQFYLDSYDAGGFSITRAGLERQLADAAVETYDLEGERIPKAVYGNLAVYAASESDISAVRNLLAQADRECTYDTAILRIISEEASAYSGSDMTAEKIAENIQNRVQLYLNE